MDGRVKPGIKTRMFFHIMRILNKKGWNKVDSLYWEKKGWTGKEKPWV